MSEAQPSKNSIHRAVVGRDSHKHSIVHMLTSTTSVEWYGHPASPAPASSVVGRALGDKITARSPTAPVRRKQKELVQVQLIVRHKSFIAGFDRKYNLPLSI